MRIKKLPLKHDMTGSSKNELENRFFLSQALPEYSEK